MKMFENLNEEFRMDLQLFAEDDDADNNTDNEETEGTDNEDTQDDEEKEFDINSILENEEFQKHLQKITDKRVSDAVSKRDKHWKSKIKEEKRKSEMSQEEILAEKEKELADRELKLEKISLFKEKEWDLDLVDYVSGSDIDEIEEKTEQMLEVINKVAEKKVKERLDNSNYTPPSGKGKKFTLDDVDNMSAEEINKNWDTIQKLMKG